MRKLVFILLGFLLLGSGLAMAYPVNATVNASYDYTRWYWDPGMAMFTYDVDTEGGNITEVNVTAVEKLTDRWAGLFGDITATEIVLKEVNDGAGTNLYNWTAVLDGEICVSTGSNFDFSAIESATETEVDGQWTFGSVSDNVTETYTGTTCSLVFADITPANTANAHYIDHMTSSSFITCAYKDTSGAPGGQNDLAFCTEINDTGTNYKGNSVDYELMVPTDDGVGATETYYFFVEIN